jgi:hypothetical protein
LDCWKTPTIHTPFVLRLSYTQSHDNSSGERSESSWSSGEDRGGHGVIVYKSEYTETEQQDTRSPRWEWAQAETCCLLKYSCMQCGQPPEATFCSHRAIWPAIRFLKAISLIVHSLLTSQVRPYIPRYWVDVATQSTDQHKIVDAQPLRQYPVPLCRLARCSGALACRSLSNSAAIASSSSLSSSLLFSFKRLSGRDDSDCRCDSDGTCASDSDSKCDGVVAVSMHQEELCIVLSGCEGSSSVQHPLF